MPGVGPLFRRVLRKRHANFEIFAINVVFYRRLCFTLLPGGHLIANKQTPLIHQAAARIINIIAYAAIYFIGSVGWVPADTSLCKFYVYQVQQRHC